MLWYSSQFYHCLFQQVRVVKFLHKKLFLNRRFTCIFLHKYAACIHMHTGAYFHYLENTHIAKPLVWHSSQCYHCLFQQVHVVKFLHEKLFLNRRFTSEQIQRVCGILDTNCYELGWKGIRARAIFQTIARINHDCIPNARRFFDSEYRMVVVSSRDIYPGEEVTLSYTPPLTSTPVRQVGPLFPDILKY